MGALLGIIFHAIGGFAAGSFYMPFKLVKKWSWESAWFILGIAAWLIAPLVFAFFTVPDLMSVLSGADNGAKMWTYIFGFLWGIGGLTFGLSMRYLGISLGMTIALGFCTAFGTLIPPIYGGTFMELMSSSTGQITLLGVILCLVAIGVVGKAGMMKENELQTEDQENTVKEFNLKIGLTVAIISGILSACFAFGLTAGKPIAELASQSGAQDLFKNNAALVWILWGGFTTNGLYCLFLNKKNHSFSDYSDQESPLGRNYFWAMLGGLTWYLQFFFYGMGETLLGEKYSFASWSIHMAFIILFSNLWGMYLKEWKGASAKTMKVLYGGLLLIVVAISMIGLANFLFG